MNQENLICLVRRTPTTHGIRLHFKTEEGLGLVYRLCAEAHALVLGERDMLNLLVAVGLKNWGGGLGLTVSVMGLDSLHDDAPTELASHVEHMEFGGFHGAESLASPRFKKREEAAKRITEEVLAPQFVADLTSQGYFAVAGLEKFRGSFCLQFDIGKLEGGHTFKIRIDGWTGMMLHGDTFLDYEKPYQGSADVQRVIWSFLIKERHKRERLTLVAA